MLSGEIWTPGTPEKRTCDSKPESNSAKKQIKTVSELKGSYLTVDSLIQHRNKAKQRPTSKQIVLETEQPGSQVDKKSHYISKDIGKA